MKKKLSYFTLLLALLLLLGFVALHHIVPYAIIQPPRINEQLHPQQFKLPYDTLALTTRDSITLKGYWIKSQQDTTAGIIILVHGIGGCKEHFLGLAQELSSQGIASIVFDGRAHGQSGGQFCTYGFYEKYDIVQLVDYIQKRTPDLPIGIWGNSMGGAVTIQALAVEPRLDFGLIESTFTDLSQIVFDYKKRLLKGVGIRAFSNYALSRAGEIAQFAPQQVRPIEAVQQIQQPVFLAHGDADQNIKVDYSKQLFEQLNSKDKQLVIVEGAGHFSMYEHGGANYKNQIMAFIWEQLQ